MRKEIKCCLVGCEVTDKLYIPEEGFVNFSEHFHPQCWKEHQRLIKPDKDEGVIYFKPYRVASVLSLIEN